MDAMSLRSFCIVAVGLTVVCCEQYGYNVSFSWLMYHLELKLNNMMKPDTKVKTYTDLIKNPLINAEECAKVFPPEFVAAFLKSKQSDRKTRTSDRETRAHTHTSSAHTSSAHTSSTQSMASGTKKRRPTKHVAERDVVDLSLSVSPNHSVDALACAPVPTVLKSPISPAAFVEYMHTHHVKGEPKLDNRAYNQLPSAYIIDPTSRTIVASAVVLVSPTHHVPQGALTSSPPFQPSKQMLNDIGYFEDHVMPLAFVQQKVSRETCIELTRHTRMNLECCALHGIASR
jgi:hypothetical protein